MSHAATPSITGTLGEDITLEAALAALYATIDWCVYLHPDATHIAVMEARMLVSKLSATGIMGAELATTVRDIRRTTERLSEVLEEAALEANDNATADDLLAEWEGGVSLPEPEVEVVRPKAPERLEA